MKHYHWEIQAYIEKGRYPKDNPAYKTWPRDYIMIDTTIVDILAINQEEALEKAKGIYKKQFYRIGKVYECHQSNSDPEDQKEMQRDRQEMQFEALAIQKLMLKKLS